MIERVQTLWQSPVLGIVFVIAGVCVLANIVMTQRSLRRDPRRETGLANYLQRDGSLSPGDVHRLEVRERLATLPLFAIGAVALVLYALSRI